MASPGATVDGGEDCPLLLPHRLPRCCAIFCPFAAAMRFRLFRWVGVGVGCSLGLDYACGAYLEWKAHTGQYSDFQPGLQELQRIAAQNNTTPRQLLQDGAQCLLHASYVTDHALRGIPAPPVPADAAPKAAVPAMQPLWLTEVRPKLDLKRGKVEGTRVHVVLREAPAGSALTLCGGRAYSPWDAFLASLWQPEQWQPTPLLLRRPYDGWAVRGWNWGSADLLWRIPGQSGAYRTESVGQLIRCCNDGEAPNVALFAVPLPADLPAHLRPYVPTSDARRPRYFGSAAAGPLVMVAVALSDLRIGDELRRPALSP